MSAPAVALQAIAAVQFPDYVAGIAWRPDSSMVAVACTDGSVHELLPHGGASAPVQHHDGGACAVAYAADGTLASAGEDGRVAVGPIPPQPAGSGWVERIAWSPDGALLASAAGRRIGLRGHDGRLVAESDDLPATVECIAWSPAGDRLAAGGHGGVSILGRDAAPVSARVEWTGVVLEVEWAPDGRRLACGMQDLSVWVWDAVADRAATMRGYARKVRELAWSADGRWLATGGGRTGVAWRFDGPEPLPSEATGQVELRGHEKAITWAGFQPGGALLATAAEDGVAILWSLPGEAPLTGATVGEEAVACAWSPDGTMLAIGGRTGRLAIFALA